MAAPKSAQMEASDMLAEALKQMDGLLADLPTGYYLGSEVHPPGTARKELKHPQTNGGGTGTGAQEVDTTHSPKLAPRMQQAKAVRLLEELKGALDGLHHSHRVYSQLPQDTREFLDKWFNMCNNKVQKQPSVNGVSSAGLEDKVRALSGDNDNLSLQVSVLNEQIEAQTDKIRDLEEKLEKQRDHSSDSEMRTPEPHKLDLLAEVTQVKVKLASSEKERQELMEKYNQTQKRMDELQARLNDRTIEVTELRSKMSNSKFGSLDRSDSGRERTLEKDRKLDTLKRKHNEIETLKTAVESLVQQNAEKDQHIEELKKLIRRYKRIEEMVLSAQGKKALEGFDLDNLSDTSSTHNSATSSDNRENAPMERLDYDSTPDSRLFPNATSTPVNPYHSNLASLNGNSSPPSNIYNMARSNSCEDVTPQHGKTPPTVKRKGPGLTENEPLDEEALKDEMALEYKAIQERTITTNPEQKKKKGGIRKLFGKLKRSNSQEFNENGLGDGEAFKRGGVRATAGARLGWSKDFQYSDISVPFSKWDTDRCASWLNSIGLTMYVTDCRRWVRNGGTLLKATQQDLEKELGMKNHYHRKKLHLALNAVTSGEESQVETRDHNWVTRWLDDIGLPQYKDNFVEARVDARMLNYLTVDDLVGLKVTNTLHHLSIKRGIQVLRMNQFSSSCLKRRPLPNEGSINCRPDEVLLWTNHRVMEWLRSIDFSEYAPNLRGSGVHGGLMVLEPRFGAELFATILSIPSSKTLLRRHLSTHFVSLLGNRTQQRKRDVEQQPGFVPLTPNQKIKMKKRLFSSHKKPPGGTETDDLVLPFGSHDSDTLFESTNGSSTLSSRENSLTRNGSLPRDASLQREHMLTKEKFFDDVPTSNV